ncbi:hypothetical protein FHR83_006766 [Actinoplanes campanulatus]|uniref:Uncharacterized protein n=1 Tax=Actinoplanes campanulatus TaxID=113559 RepID=A0A7W5AMW2_9ACTN|nr:hypothetical protein [Actinoplanes campanulatus]MBB3099060.1 hypothetical protein [Actinoplanes campanulatus]GGN39225.1 hypothetical protein GCM10010109_66920 [Actinoplanes campanulatus]GID40217.1 hypothetical protein Aca09nite_67230 [Actinoplanes campanulatus]
MFGITRDNSPQPAGPAVPPLHYQHCREDVNAYYQQFGDKYDYDKKLALGVVDAAEAAGVSVWKALPTEDGFTYESRLRLAAVWKKAGRGPAADREEFYA